MDDKLDFNFVVHLAMLSSKQYFHKLKLRINKKGMKNKGGNGYLLNIIWNTNGLKLKK